MALPGFGRTSRASWSPRASAGRPGAIRTRPVLRTLSVLSAQQDTEPKLSCDPGDPTQGRSLPGHPDPQDGTGRTRVPPSVTCHLLLILRHRPLTPGRTPIPGRVDTAPVTASRIGRARVTLGKPFSSQQRRENWVTAPRWPRGHQLVPVGRVWLEFRQRLHLCCRGGREEAMGPVLGWGN